MTTYEGKELALKMLNGDYDRWMRYIDECTYDRRAFTKSFHTWKQDQGSLDKDAADLAEILG